MTAIIADGVTFYEADLLGDGFYADVPLGSGGTFPRWMALLVGMQRDGAAKVKAAAGSADAAQAAARAAASDAAAGVVTTALALSTSASASASTALTAAATASTQAQAAVSAAASAHDYALTISSRLGATSASPQFITPGPKTFRIQTEKSFTAGQFVAAVSVVAPTVQYLVGQVTAHDPGTGLLSLTVFSNGVSGSGTCSAWWIVPSGPPGPAGAIGAMGPSGPGDALVYEQVPASSILTIGAGQQLMVFDELVIDGDVLLNGTLGVNNG